MINARNNINDIFAEKIIVNDILDNLEYYKDKNLIKFLRKNNPEVDEFYNYENKVIQEFRKNNQYCREIECRRLFKQYGIKDSDYNIKITKEIIDDYKEKFFKEHAIILNEENELKYKDEILNNLKNDNEIRNMKKQK